MLQRFQQMFPIMLFLGCEVDMAKELCHKALIMNSNYTTNRVGLPRVKEIPNLTPDEVEKYREEIQDCLSWTMRRISEVEPSISEAMKKFPDILDNETKEQRGFRLSLEEFVTRSIEKLKLDPDHFFNRKASSKEGYNGKNNNARSNFKSKFEKTRWAPYERNIHCWRHTPFQYEGGHGVKWTDRTDKWRPEESLRYGNIRSEERTIF
ncbi:hypothetical protein BZA77DRAFT_8370 [Pyronema omphalodes]|nr:hypothetical protein BZA77DRAFT_8370 [Pyronema omphalodes]